MKRGATGRAVGAVAVAVLVAAAVSGCRRAASAPWSRQWMAMGTFASLQVRGGSGDEAQQARRTLEDLEERLSLFRADSDVARLNAAAGSGAWLTVSPDTARVLALALDVGRASDGCFDTTVAPLMELWGFRGERRPGALPDGPRLAEALARVGQDGLVLEGQRARLARPGMRIDLGGIAKGYGVDRCFEVLREAGCTNVLMNLGGNLRAAGSPDGRRAWRIGVRDPFAGDGLLGDLELPDGWAMATSGNYEQAVVLDGVRYTHIMDPRTGRPVSGMAGVTVLAPSAALADAASTALFVAGLKESPVVLARLGHLEALLVPDRRPAELWMTPGFAARFHPRPDLKAVLHTLHVP